MSEESVDSVKMGVTFVMFAAALVFVVFNIIWGMDINRNSQARMDRSEEQANSRYFNEAKESDGCDMPTSGAYSLIQNNRESVAAISIGHAAHVVNGRGGELYGYVSPSSGNWLWKNVSGDTTGLLKYSTVRYKSWSFVEDYDSKGNYTIFDGSDDDEAELWLRNHMNGRCNVKAFPAGDGTYLLTIELYKD